MRDSASGSGTDGATRDASVQFLRFRHQIPLDRADTEIADHVELFRGFDSLRDDALLGIVSQRQHEISQEG